MISAKPTVLYDACVLYPAPLRDLLLWLGLSGLFKARWTTQIHEEWQRNLLMNRPDLTSETLAHTARLMDRAIPDALITGYESLIPTLQLPDVDDRHVLAAAVKGGVQTIVTFNLKDFPNDVLQQFNIEATHPDDFVSDLMDLDLVAVLQSVKQQRSQLKRPPMNVQTYLDMLIRQGLVQTAKDLNAYHDFI